MNKLSLLSITVFFAGTLSAMEPDHAKRLRSEEIDAVAPASPRTKFLLEELRLGNEAIKQLLPERKSSSHAEETTDRSLEYHLNWSEKARVTQHVCAWVNHLDQGFPIPTEGEFLLQEKDLLEFINHSEENKDLMVRSATDHRRVILSEPSPLARNTSVGALQLRVKAIYYPRLKRESLIAKAKLAQYEATIKPETTIDERIRVKEEIWRPYQACLNRIELCLHAIRNFEIGL
jgi:hypothetical protein